MPRYSKPIDLERLERALRNTGFDATQLVVRAGVQSIEMLAGGSVWVIDQFGNLDHVTVDGAPVPETPVTPPANLAETIRSFRAA